MWTDRRLHRIDGHPVVVTDLLEAGLIEPDTPLTWIRPRIGETYNAQVLSTGAIRLGDGRTYSSPSLAAREAAGIVAYNGWNAWKVPDGQTLAQLRTELLEQRNPDNGQRRVMIPALPRSGYPSSASVHRRLPTARTRRLRQDNCRKMLSPMPRSDRRSSSEGNAGTMWDKSTNSPINQGSYAVSYSVGCRFESCLAHTVSSSFLKSQFIL